MFRGWLDKVNDLFDEKPKPDQILQKPYPVKHSIFDLPNENRILISGTNLFNNNRTLKSPLFYQNSDTELILTPIQIKSFNYKFYKLLNKEVKEENEETSNLNNKQIKTDSFSQIYHFFHRQSVSQEICCFSEFELEFIQKETLEKIHAYVFQKFRGLIKSNGIFENIYYIESQVNFARREIEGKMLINSGGKLNKLEGGFVRAVEIYEQASDTTLKVRKLRFCLMELKKSHVAIRKIQNDFKKKGNIRRVLDGLEGFKQKAIPVIRLLDEQYSVEIMARNYEALISSRIFCGQQMNVKINQRLKIFEKLAPAIDRKIEFWKTKLKQSFILQIRLYKTNRESFKELGFEKIIEQMLAVEKTGKVFEKLKQAELVSVNQFLMEDKEMYKRIVFELENQSGWIDESTKTMISKTHQKLVKKLKV